MSAHASSSHGASDISHEHPTSGGSRVIKMILLAIAALVLFGMCARRIHKPKEQTNAAGKQVETPSQVPVIEQPPPKCGAYQRRTDALAIPEEGLHIYLCPGWQDFPMGGAVTITDPNGRKYHDDDKDLHYFGNPPEGWYKVEADPIGSKRKIIFLTHGPLP